MVRTVLGFRCGRAALAGAFAACALAFSGSVSAAGSGASVTYWFGANQPTRIDDPAFGVPYAATYTNVGTISTVTGRAQAGSVGASAFTSVMSGDSLVSGVSSGWFDTFVIDSPGLAGTRGFFSVVVPYSWAISLTNPSAFGNAAVAEVLLDVTTTPTTSFWTQVNDGLVATNCGGAQCPTARSAVWQTQSTTRVTAPGPGTVGGTFQFVYGTPITLVVQLTARTRLQGGASGVQALVDGMHTVTWGGLDVLGQTNFSVTSASGFDYRHAFAVSEPGSGVLLLMGLAFALRLAKGRPARAAA